MDLMKEYAQTQIKTDTMTKKQQALKDAIGINAQANQEHRSIFEKYYDSILLYSASIFSFTLAIIGVIDQKKEKALTSIGFIFPNIYWLYGCWFFFLLTCFLIIARKRFDALYVQAEGMEFYTKAYLDKEKAEHDFAKSYPGKLIMIKTPEENEKIQQETISTLETAVDKNTKLSEKYYRIMSALSYILEATSVLGVLFLLIFAIQFSQNLIW